MKTAISIPNPLFDMAEEFAKQLRISRSELYAKALAEYIRSYQRATVTECLTQIYAHEDSAVEPVLSQLQRAAIARRIGNAALR